ncbi:hypothetical protein ACER0A_011485 [Haloimpatiens sp. FM7315]|uniref:hypothetical protein n=1 Tax=Haloimpatiens sp. FM7315 TaxID=3298609 RepID=UPI0035A3587D
MNMNQGNMQIDQRNLKTIEDQLAYEALMNKKCSQYADYCTDSQLKQVCSEGANIHKNNFTTLKNYLDSHN